MKVRSYTLSERKRKERKETHAENGSRDLETKVQVGFGIDYNKIAEKGSKREREGERERERERERKRKERTGEDQ